MVASILFYTLMCWGGSSSKKDLFRLKRLIRYFDYSYRCFCTVTTRTVLSWRHCLKRSSSQKFEKLAISKTLYDLESQKGSGLTQMNTKTSIKNGTKTTSVSSFYQEQFGDGQRLFQHCGPPCHIAGPKHRQYRQMLRAPWIHRGRTEGWFLFRLTAYQYYFIYYYFKILQKKQFNSLLCISQKVSEQKERPASPHWCGAR